MQFNTQKGEADLVEFTISYHKSRAIFHMNTLKPTAEEIKEDEKQAMNEFVEERTVDVVVEH